MRKTKGIHYPYWTIFRKVYPPKTGWTEEMHFGYYASHAQADKELVDRRREAERVKDGETQRFSYWMALVEKPGQRKP